MDIKAKAEELVKKITGNKELLAKFKSDPKDTVKSLVSDNLDDDTVGKIADVVKTKINLDESGITSKLSGLFKKK